MANFDAFTDGVTALDQAHLDGLVPAQMSYLVSGGIASSAAALVITQPATVAVINDGTQAKRVAVSSTTVTCGAAGAAQDNYVDLAIGGTYTVTTQAAGTGAPSVATNAIRLYKATTNAGNTAVVTYTDLANRSPIGAAQPLGVASLDANGKVVQLAQSLAACRAYQSTNVAKWSGLAAVPLNTTDYDTLPGGAAQHSVSVNTSRLTCQLAGIYIVTVSCLFSLQTDGTTRVVQIVKNGATVYAQANGPAAAQATRSASAIVQLVANDYIELYAQNDGTSDPYSIYGATLTGLSWAKVA